MIKVFLREKKLKKGKIGLYLDFYPPIIIDGKKTRREHLKLYVFERANYGGPYRRERIGTPLS